MSEQKHTPEPWRVELGHADWGMPVSHVITADAFTGSPRIEYLAELLSIQPYCLGASQKDLKFAATQQANARRIVACVNACAGIDTETLEGLAASGRTIANMIGQECVARVRAESQRDQLLAALKEARRAIGDHDAPRHCYATGPLTGNDYRDLVECPACSAIAMYEAVIAAVEAGK